MKLLGSILQTVRCSCPKTESGPKRKQLPSPDEKLKDKSVWQKFYTGVIFKMLSGNNGLKTWQKARGLCLCTSVYLVISVKR